MSGEEIAVPGITEDTDIIGSEHRAQWNAIDDKVEERRCATT